MKKQATITINGLTVSADLDTLKALVGITETVNVETHAKAPKTPKAPKTEKTPKAKTPKTPKAEKAEKDPSEPLYTRGGAVVQYPDNHTLTRNQLARVKYAVRKLEAAGFTVTWKRCGDWGYIYQATEEKNNKAFQAVKLPKGWEIFKGAWVDKELCKGNADSFKAEK